MIDEWLLLSLLAQEKDENTSEIKTKPYFIESLGSGVYFFYKSNNVFEWIFKSKNNFSQLPNGYYDWCLTALTNDPYTKKDTMFTNLGYTAMKCQIPECSVSVKNNILHVTTIRNGVNNVAKLRLNMPMRRVEKIDWSDEHRLEPNVGMLLPIEESQCNFFVFDSIYKRFEYLHGVKNKIYTKTMNISSRAHPCEIQDIKEYASETQVYNVLKNKILRES